MKKIIITLFIFFWFWTGVNAWVTPDKTYTDLSVNACGLDSVWYFFSSNTNNKYYNISVESSDINNTTVTYLFNSWSLQSFYNCPIDSNITIVWSGSELILDWDWCVHWGNTAYAYIPQWSTWEVWDLECAWVWDYIFDITTIDDSPPDPEPSFTWSLNDRLNSVVSWGTAWVNTLMSGNVWSILAFLIWFLILWVVLYRLNLIFGWFK